MIAIPPPTIAVKTDIIMAFVIVLFSHLVSSLISLRSPWSSGLFGFARVFYPAAGEYDLSFLQCLSSQMSSINPLFPPLVSLNMTADVYVHITKNMKLKIY
jgi:hypothetical protein